MKDTELKFSVSSMLFSSIQRFFFSVDKKFVILLNWLFWKIEKYTHCLFIKTSSASSIILMHWTQINNKYSTQNKQYKMNVKKRRKYRNVKYSRNFTFSFFFLLGRALACYVLASAYLIWGAGTGHQPTFFVVVFLCWVCFSFLFWQFCFVHYFYVVVPFPSPLPYSYVLYP